jgi:ribonuclease D
LQVFHGCDSDILGLQRDHGLFIVNLFDTGQVDRQLAGGAVSSHLLVATSRRVARFVFCDQMQIIETKSFQYERVAA